MLHKLYDLESGNHPAAHVTLSTQRQTQQEAVPKATAVRSPLQHMLGGHGRGDKAAGGQSRRGGTNRGHLAQAACTTLPLAACPESTNTPPPMGQVDGSSCAVTALSSELLQYIFNGCRHTSPNTMSYMGRPISWTTL